MCQNQQAVARTNSLRALFVLRTFLAGNNDCSTLKSIIVLSVCSKNNFYTKSTKKISVKHKTDYTTDYHIFNICECDAKNTEH